LWNTALKSLIRSQKDCNLYSNTLVVMKETTSGYTVLPKGLEKKEEKKNFQL
jgi:hypothetical protein